MGGGSSLTPRAMQTFPERMLSKNQGRASGVPCKEQQSYQLPGTVLETVYVMTHVILTTALGVRTVFISRLTGPLLTGGAYPPWLPPSLRPSTWCLGSVRLPVPPGHAGPPQTQGPACTPGGSAACGGWGGTGQGGGLTGHYREQGPLSGI